MISLPHVTLLCADCLNGERAIVALERSLRGVKFGAVKFLTSQKIADEFPGYPHLVVIPPINSINDYSAFCLKRLHEFVDTSHLLLVQHDGCVLNPGAWNPAWDGYDYMGPLFEQDRVLSESSVGSGGFSYRSRRLCAAVSAMCPAWDGQNSYDGPDGRNNWGHEDGGICYHYRGRLKAQGMVFAPPEHAAVFAHGRSPFLRCPTSFGFHGYCPEIEARGVDSTKVQDAAAYFKRLYTNGHTGPLSAVQVAFALGETTG